MITSLLVYAQFSNNNNLTDETSFASTMDIFDKIYGGLTSCDVLTVNENDSSGIVNGDISCNYGAGNN
jgi:hypothetical protein